MSGRLRPFDPQVDHARGPEDGRVIVEYGDYECPYSRMASRAVEALMARPRQRIRFVFRHYPLTDIHPHAVASAHAAEAAAMQGRFWEMHDLLYHNQHALEDSDLRRYAADAGLDVDAFDRDRRGTAVSDRVQRDVDSGNETGEVEGTPTIFIDGAIYRGDLDSDAFAAALA